MVVYKLLFYSGVSTISRDKDTQRKPSFAFEAEVFTLDTLKKKMAKTDNI
jgi:hypothetical protein